MTGSEGWEKRGVGVPGAPQIQERGSHHAALSRRNAAGEGGRRGGGGDQISKHP